VVTLNAVAAGHAVNDFLMCHMGFVGEDTSIDYQRFEHRYRRRMLDEPREETSGVASAAAVPERFGWPKSG